MLEASLITDQMHALLIPELCARFVSNGENYSMTLFYMFRVSTKSVNSVWFVRYACTVHVNFVKTANEISLFAVC